MATTADQRKWRQYICSVSCQVRLDALGLLCECPKSTEPVSGVDLRLLRTFAALNMNSQAPAFRQQAAASIRKVSCSEISPPVVCVARYKSF